MDLMDSEKDGSGYYHYSNVELMFEYRDAEKTNRILRNFMLSKNDFDFAALIEDYGLDRWQHKTHLFKPIKAHYPGIVLTEKNEKQILQAYHGLARENSPALTTITPGEIYGLVFPLQGKGNYICIQVSPDFICDTLTYQMQAFHQKWVQIEKKGKTLLGENAQFIMDCYQATKQSCEIFTRQTGMEVEDALENFERYRPWKWRKMLAEQALQLGEQTNCENTLGQSCLYDVTAQFSVLQYHLQEMPEIATPVLGN